MSKRIIQFFLLLGFLVLAGKAYGQTLRDEKDYQKITVQSGDKVSGISKRATRDGNNWRKVWVLVVDRNNRVRSDKNFILPGWQVWVKRSEIKTTPIRITKHSLEDICGQFAAADCLKSLGFLNDIKNPSIALNQAVYVPDAYPLRATRMVMKPRMEIVKTPAANPQTIYRLSRIFAVLVVGFCCLIAILFIWVWVWTKIRFPEAKVPKFRLPLFRERREKLTFIRSDIIYRITQDGIIFDANALKIHKFRNQITYDARKTDDQVNTVLNQVQKIYEDETGAQLGYVTRPDGLRNYTITVVKFPKLGTSKIERIREIGCAWINPEMTAFTSTLAAKFNSPQGTDKHPEPFGFTPIPDPRSGILVIEINSRTRKKISDIPDTEEYLDELIREINDLRFEKQKFAVTDGKGVLTLKFSPTKEQENEVSSMRLRYG